MFVEVIYGLVSNSLGLLTDGAHMLLDCSAIVIGLYSSYLSDNKSDKNYNFGYQRSEVMGTFINSVFLVFVSLYIVFESVERFINPKEIHSDHLILISFLGLVVNLIGVYYLHGEHGHDHSGHSHEVKHSHEHHQGCSHKEDVESGHKEKEKHSHEYNENLYAIYIHILADALGSVSVLISSFLIRYYNLTFTDPLCSLFISIMILYSVWPVIKSSTSTLLHMLPEKLEKKKLKIEKSIVSLNIGNSATISVSHFDIWVLNKNHYVSDIKVSLDFTKNNNNNNNNTSDETNLAKQNENIKSEIYQKIKSIFKENKIEEFYIGLI